LTGPHIHVVERALQVILALVKHQRLTQVSVLSWVSVDSSDVRV